MFLKSTNILHINIQFSVTSAKCMVTVRLESDPGSVFNSVV